jgi:RNA polymerase sigma-70 factor (ECF subfamily)
VRKTDEELVAGAQRGDTEAFGELVVRYQHRVVNLVSRMVGRRESVEDVAQEVFIKAYRKIDGFRFESSFFTWLYTITLNTCRNHYRKKSLPMVLPREDDEDDPISHLPSTEGGADEALFRKQRSEIITDALQQLGHDQREALIMCDLEGMSYEEIAAVTGVPIGTVRSRIFRGRAQLRNILPREVWQE